ncbi:hypothetical protein [Microbacterium soli]|uniref:Extradiol ring-cleavage dioxygenase LigAB LigA subunit domain-containing protein n=1 Tax=Microbacterium soli TaxID=446075 RepID=A0ABP7N8K2_9MICO
MALDKPYQFAMSLMKPENRERFLDDQAGYLDDWDLNPVQRRAVLDMDLNTMIAEVDAETFEDAA